MIAHLFHKKESKSVINMQLTARVTPLLVTVKALAATVPAGAGMPPRAAVGGQSHREAGEFGGGDP